jgi:acetoin utilization protein AcuC
LETRKAAFIHSPKMEKFSYPSDCPFNVTRAGKVRQILGSMGLLAGAGRMEVAPAPATRLALKKFHSARYLYVLKEAAKGRFNSDAYSMGIGTPDCPVFEDMYDYSAWTCGATLTGVKLILSGKVDVAFNPSGGLHHSGPELASGFCYMNDVALACTVLAEAKKKVLYLDVDVHFGDGVAKAFYDRSDVMTISFHESGRTLFPGTGFEDEIGAGDGKGYCVNVPMPVGTYDKAYMMAFKAIALPLAGAFNPDVMVLQLGADGLAGDPLAHLCLTNNVYADIIHQLLNFNKPIVATGGGGYNIENTVRAWALDWTVLSGADRGLDAHLGAGGIMLESTEWQGGLHDRELLVTKHQQEIVLPQVEATIEKLKTRIFPLHSL